MDGNDDDDMTPLVILFMARLNLENKWKYWELDYVSFLSRIIIDIYYCTV